MDQYVERECLRCEEGRIHVGTPQEVKTDNCPDCEGSGKVLSYLYPKPKGRRGPWPPEEVAAEAQQTVTRLQTKTLEERNIVKNAERNAIERGEKRDRRVREAVELLDAGVEEILEGEAFKRYLAFAAKFHGYSSNNALLILVQRPNATRVAGYRKWQQLGRQVRRGEEGLKILAPIFRTVEDDETGDKARMICSFKVVKVFDISQTDPIPGVTPPPEKPRPKALNGDSEAARVLGRSLLSFCESESVPVSENDSELDTLSPGANGVYSRREKRIILRSKLSANGRAKTLVHELAHHLLHRDPTAMEADRPTFEAEAEGTAYTVLSYFGVDASNYSFAYVAYWAERKELFKTTISNIQKAAHEIIESVESGWMRTEKESERGAA